MPTYSYQCKRCDHVQDVFHAMSVTPRVKCEVCGGSCKRLLGTGAGIIFKGSGFYETDYKRKDKRPAVAGGKAKPDTTPASSDSKPGETKSGGDTKATPAAKAG